MISSKGLTFTHQGSNPNPTGTGKSTVYAMSDGLYVDGNKLAASGAGADYSEMTISSTQLTTNINQNGWNTTGYYNLFAGGAGITINGILYDGGCRVKTLTNSNTGVTNIQTITHMSASASTPTARIFVSPQGTDYKLHPGESITLVYLQPSTYWTVMSSRLPQNEWMPLDMTGVLTGLYPPDLTGGGPSNAYYKQSYAGPGGIVEIVFNMLVSITFNPSDKFTFLFNIPAICGTVESHGGTYITVVGSCTTVQNGSTVPTKQGSVVTYSDDKLMIIGGGELGINPHAQVRILFVRKT